MIGYNFSIRGRRHEKANMPCQDYCLIEDFGGLWKIAAVADGVSSSKYSDKASKLACKTAVEYIKNAFPFDSYSFKVCIDDLAGTMKSAMHAAQNKIEEFATDNRHNFEDYDTTLVLALYNGESAYVALVGDSGVVALHQDGKISHSLPMNDEYGCVYPLRCRSAYQLLRFDSVASIMLMTDGIFKDDLMQQGYFDKNKAEEYIPYQLMSFDSPVNTEEYIISFKKKICEQIKNDEKLSDDMSIAVLINEEEIVPKLSFDIDSIFESYFRSTKIYGKKHFEIFKCYIQKYVDSSLTNEEIERIFACSGKVDKNNFQKSDFSKSNLQPCKNQSDEKNMQHEENNQATEGQAKKTDEKLSDKALTQAEENQNDAQTGTHKKQEPEPAEVEKPFRVIKMCEAGKKGEEDEASAEADEVNAEADCEE